MPFTEGETEEGWGVVRLSPWDFRGIYKGRGEAEVEAARLGRGYRVLWGENRKGTDDFVFSETLNRPAFLQQEEFDLLREDGERLLTEGGDRLTAEGDVDLPEGTYGFGAFGEGPFGGTRPPVEPEQTLSDEELQSIDEMGGAFDPDPDDPASATRHTSSRWTGRLSLQEHLVVVRKVAPIAAQCVQDLIDSIEAKRLNSPDARDTLDQLRQLHHALGELIQCAEAGKPLDRILESIEVHKEKVACSLRNGAQVMLVAPSVAVGASFMLSLLTGYPMSDNMVTALCATMMGKDALLTLARRGES